MADEIPVTRRTFLKVVGSGVVTITVSGLPAAISGCTSPGVTDQPKLKSAARCAASQHNSNNAPDWAPEPGKARWRIEGVHKVTGRKIYARDYKAADFEDWPTQENWLYALRCNRIDRIVDNIDLTVLPDKLQPIVVITNHTLTDYRIAPSQLGLGVDPQSKQDIYFFARLGYRAECYGQPVALLIFENFDIYRRARKLLEFNNEVIRYGKPAPPAASATTAFASPKLYVRNDETSFSNLIMTLGPSGSASQAFYDQCRAVRREILELAAQKTKAGEWVEFGASTGPHFQTPAIDPVFMEPEAGLAWYKADTGTLQLVLGTQSASDDGQSAFNLFVKSKIQVNDVHVMGCYPGGGFGGRDKSYFPLYLSLAAPFARGALRWQQSRYEQFQVGLKRSETEFEESIWFDHGGRIQVLDSDFTLNGGGKKNLSASVADLAAMSAMSCYDIPRASASAKAMYTPEVFGGSQRGFGGPQAFMAIETLMDEAAYGLHRSPFDIRRANLLRKDRGKTITGAPILFDLQLDELLHQLESHPLWLNREKTRTERLAQKLKYGIGLAMSNQAYGTGKDGAFAMVQIQADTSLRVLTHYTDMGNGAATALGLAPAGNLGQNARAVVMSEVDAFKNALKGVSDAEFGVWTCDKRTRPMSTPYGSSSACLGAFHHFHAVEGASYVLMLHTVLPAARALWKDPNVKADDIRWVDGMIGTTGDHPKRDWGTLLAKINEMKLPTVAVVHETYAGDFWKGCYDFTTGNVRVDYDFVAVGTAPFNLTPLPRLDLKEPKDTFAYGRTNYAPAASLVAVTVDPKTGRVRVEHVVTSLSAGRLLCPEVVSGQSQGAVAMALGNVLSENCPLGPDGPGNGRWNLDRYQIMRMTDIPKQQLITLPPPKEGKSARGIGEAVMCPIGPALLNALAMATGHRFRQTPVTPEKIREALR
jgi:CO/xanthine dehydrogenase Mo-binding subunit